MLDYPCYNLLTELLQGFYRLPSKLVAVVCCMFSILLASCVQFVVPALSETPGFYSGYERLNEKDKESIVFLSSNEKIDSMCIDKNKVFSVNAAQLIEYMEQFDSCLIYFFTPNCHSEVCVLPSACQQYCSDNGYQFLLIFEYYEIPAMYDILASIKNYSFSINTNYYKTDYCPKYVRKFKRELLNGSKSETLQSRYWVFKKGTFERVISDIFTK